MNNNPNNSRRGIGRLKKNFDTSYQSTKKKERSKKQRKITSNKNITWMKKYRIIWKN